MKTRNIRWMVLMLVAAIATDVVAQKSVLKAFDKMKDSKGVVVKKIIGATSPEPGKWRSNVVEFQIPKMDDARKYIARIDEAFTKESQKGNVTYYTRMKALSERSTDQEKEAYKKIQVKCDLISIPVTIGMDPSYHAVVLRFHTNAHYRTVVAMEWKMGPGFGCQGRLYEIEGMNESLWEEPHFPLFNPYNPVPAKKEQRTDNITTRMHFYRDTYDGEDNSDNSALLLNMTEYLNANWEKASETERNMILLILQDMAGRSKAKMHRDLINQCSSSLKDATRSDNEVIKRIELYIEDFKACKQLYQKDEILDQVKQYVSTQVKSGLDAKTVNEVYERLLRLKQSATQLYQKDHVADIVRLLEKK